MYKYIFTFLFSLFATTLLAQQSSSIEGEIEGISEGQLQLVVRSSESRWELIHTVAFANGRFSMPNIELTEPLPARLMVTGYQGGFSFFIEPGTDYRALCAMARAGLCAVKACKTPTGHTNRSA
ncbi:DUF4369 domain-containing protein [Prevotella conceptionensis]|uniref:DUF4369 domain-containing protein n=1 Tax=Prevotella conceptionensis TaxID=340486 RepID=UPI0002DAAEC2|nr:DUF4369 domain-containing protein [Prevotella conceptionensis]